MYESVYLKQLFTFDNFNKFKNQITPKRIANLLSVFIVIASLFLIVWPYFPRISWWSGHHLPVINRNYGAVAPVKSQAIPNDNELIIPRLGLKDHVNEGQYITELRYGLWRVPTSSTPDQGSNTVIVGHRFTYSGEGVFYNLDKVQVGDNLIIYWLGKEYDYRVTNIFVAQATDLSVEDPTINPTLTLYTCTPFWTFDKRLVVRAQLI